MLTRFEQVCLVLQNQRSEDMSDAFNTMAALLLIEMATDEQFQAALHRLKEIAETKV